MKKLSRLLTAVILCLALLALPMQAMAEPMDMLTLTISDPVLLYNGQTMMDMTGLAVDMTGGATADMSKGTFQLQVRGGNATALAALAEFADGKLVLAADGLNDKYSISLESLVSLLGISSGMSSGYGYGPSAFQIIGGMSDAFTQLASGSLFEDLMVPVEDFSDELASTMQDMGTVNYRMLSGEMTMQHSRMQATPEMVDRFLNNLFSIMDNNAEFQNLMGVVADLSGEYELRNTSIADLYAQANLSQKFDIDLYTNEDGSCGALEAVQAISEAEYDSVSEVHYRLLMEQPSYDVVNFYFDIDVYENGTAEGGLYLAMQQTSADNMSMEFGAGSYYGDEFETEALYRLTVAPMMFGSIPGIEVRIEVEADGETFTADITGYEDGSHVYGKTTIDVEGISIYGSFDGESNYAGLSGNVEFGATSYGESYAIKAKLATGATTRDSYEVIIGADGAIDIENLSYSDQTSLTNSLGALLINAVSVLDRNVPGMSGILSQLIGSFSY